MWSSAGVPRDQLLVRPESQSRTWNVNLIDACVQQLTQKGPICCQSLGLLKVYSTLFVQLPIPSRLTSTISLSLSHKGGLLPEPTPCGLSCESV